MKKNILIGITAIIILLIGVGIIINNNQNLKDIDDHQGNDNILETENILEAVVLTKDIDEITIQDNNNIIYTFSISDSNIEVGRNIIIEYEGDLNKNIQLQKVKVLDYDTQEKSLNEDGLNKEWLDNGIFSDYYILANNKLTTMTLDEKISQIFLVRYPDDATAVDIQKQYQFGGYIFFKKDFADKTKEEVKNMIDKVQAVSKIPMLTAVDEEGGTVVRVSANPNLVSSPFQSPSVLYNKGGFTLIKEDTINKSKILNDLGLNLNLAPVIDVSTASNDYMYNRSLQQNTSLTSTYAETVIKASKGTNVSYTLKHFPGYGNNNDTHTAEVIDNRSYESIIQNDLPPFEAGIDSGAEAVLVSHNIVANIDKDNPASLSPSIHNLLRNELDFTGIIITDDLDMGAIDDLEEATIKAVLAGNDLIITTDYKTSINAIKKAIDNGTISEDLIDKLAFRVLAWKYYKGLIYEK